MEEKDSGYLFQGGWFLWQGCELGVGTVHSSFCGSSDSRGGLTVLATGTLFLLSFLSQLCGSAYLSSCRVFPWATGKAPL